MSTPELPERSEELFLTEQQIQNAVEILLRENYKGKDQDILPISQWRDVIDEAFKDLDQHPQDFGYLQDTLLEIQYCVQGYYKKQGIAKKHLVPNLMNRLVKALKELLPE